MSREGTLNRSRRRDRRGAENAENAEKDKIALEALIFLRVLCASASSALKESVSGGLFR